jgi:hypothetical protein
VEILRCRSTRAGESIMPAACMHVLAAALSLSLSFSLTTLAGDFVLDATVAAAPSFSSAAPEV